MVLPPERPKLVGSSVGQLGWGHHLVVCLPREVLRNYTLPALIVSISSDVLYPTIEQLELSKYMQRAQHHLIQSDEGHDGFLLEHKNVGTLVRGCSQTEDLSAACTTHSVHVVSEASLASGRVIVRCRHGSVWRLILKPRRSVVRLARPDVELRGGEMVAAPMSQSMAHRPERTRRGAWPSREGSSAHLVSVDMGPMPAI